MMEHVTHDDLEPIYNEYSKILILGSIPSRKSREEKFYYAHPQNRFWKTLEQIFQEPISNRREFLLTHHIALWDVIASCDIVGSSDSSIKNVIPNDLTHILKESQIKTIFTNGKTAEKYYQKYMMSKTKKNSINLPSTSPANCRMKENELIENWSILLQYLK